MSENKHTPGPWVVESADWWKKDNGVVRYYVRHFPPEIGMPNAQLIAAAPNLLAALKTLRLDANRLCDRCLGGTYEDDCRTAIEIADAAIAKAEGRA